MRVRRGPATVTGERTPSTATRRHPGRPGRAPIREPGHCPARCPQPGTRIPRKVRHAPRVAPGAVPVILLLSTSDTDLLSARASGAAWRPANPNRVTDLPALLAEADVVVVRILGGRRSWEEGIDAVLAAGLPVVVLGGEQAPDAEMMELSTVPAGVAAQAHTYLAQGGPENLAQLHAFLSDTVLLTGEGFAPPVELPSWGILDRDRARTRTARPSRSSTTGPSSSRGTPRTSRRCAPRSRTPARARCRCSAPRCGRPSPRCCGRCGGRRHGRHRARRRGARSRRARLRAATTRRGTSPNWPRWTSRSCRASASPAAAPTGRPTTTASPRSTSRPRSPSPSSTAG